MTASLGDLLLQTQEAERRHDVELAEQRAAQRSAQELEKFKTVQRFYEQARLTLTDQIQRRVAARELGVLVGDTGRERSNMDVYTTLALYNGLSTATATSSKYYPLWKEFDEWAQAQGLRVEWRYEHDGVGIHGWHRLTVTPSVSKRR